MSKIVEASIAKTRYNGIVENRAEKKCPAEKMSKIVEASMAET